MPTGRGRMYAPDRVPAKPVIQQRIKVNIPAANRVDQIASLHNTALVERLEKDASPEQRAYSLRCESPPKLSQRKHASYFDKRDHVQAITFHNGQGGGTLVANDSYNAPPDKAPVDPKSMSMDFSFRTPPVTRKKVVPQPTRQKDAEEREATILSSTPTAKAASQFPAAKTERADRGAPRADATTPRECKKRPSSAMARPKLDNVFGSAVDSDGTPPPSPKVAPRRFPHPDSLSSPAGSVRWGSISGLMPSAIQQEQRRVLDLCEAEHNPRQRRHYSSMNRDPINHTTKDDNNASILSPIQKMRSSIATNIQYDLRAPGSSRSLRQSIRCQSPQNIIEDKPVYAAQREHTAYLFGPRAVQEQEKMRAERPAGASRNNETTMDKDLTPHEKGVLRRKEYRPELVEPRTGNRTNVSTLSLADAIPTHEELEKQYANRNPGRFGHYTDTKDFFKHMGPEAVNTEHSSSNGGLRRAASAGGTPSTGDARWCGRDPVLGKKRYPSVAVESRRVLNSTMLEDTTHRGKHIASRQYPPRHLPSNFAWKEGEDGTVERPETARPSCIRTQFSAFVAPQMPLREQTPRKGQASQLWGVLGGSRAGSEPWGRPEPVVTGRRRSLTPQRDQMREILVAG